MKPNVAAHLEDLKTRTPQERRDVYVVASVTLTLEKLRSLGLVESSWTVDVDGLNMLCEAMEKDGQGPITEAEMKWAVANLSDRVQHERTDDTGKDRGD